MADTPDIHDAVRAFMRALDGQHRTKYVALWGSAPRLVVTTLPLMQC